MALLVILAGYGMVLGGLAWIASRVRRRGGGESLMGPFEEIWHPAAHQARIEIQVQDERAAPNPLPGDRFYDIAARLKGRGSEPVVKNAARTDLGGVGLKGP